jgi:hypothetical protein
VTRVAAHTNRRPSAFVIFGSVLEGIPAIVLFGPLLFSIARI